MKAEPENKINTLYCIHIRTGMENKSIFGMWESIHTFAYFCNWFVCYIVFDLESNSWKLFQKRVVRTKLDIYVCIYYHCWWTISPRE